MTRNPAAPSGSNVQEIAVSDIDAAETPLSDLAESALAKMASGEWRLILEHPNPAQGSSVCGFEVGKEIARRALAPQQAAPMPGVEALEWSEGESRVTADCLTGRYILDGHKGRWTVSVPTASVSKGKGPAECERKAYPSLFAAKAAAQADYKQRILSALGSYNCFCTGYAAPSARKEP